MRVNSTLGLLLLDFMTRGCSCLKPDGAHDVPYREYAFFVQIVRYKNNSRQNIDGTCGGTILDNRHILTAAHCLKDLLPQNCVVVVAVSTDQQEKYNVSDWTMKVRFNIYLHDIAIVRTNDTIVFMEDFVEAVSLPSVDYQRVGRPVEMLGYGDVFYENGRPRQKLQRITERIHNNTKECRYDNIPEDRWICTTSGASGVVHGDSGGPLLIYNHIQIGVVAGHTILGFDLHTRVYYYLHWIKKQLRK